MRYVYTALVLLVLLTAGQPARAGDEGRIYGTVTTRDGEVYEGFIRWDKNEVSWLDVLNGSKTVAYAARDDERGRRTRRWLRFDGDERPDVKESGIRFGHLRSLEPIGRDRALLTLRSGQEVELHGGSTDLGTDIREIIVEDARRGAVELDWGDLDRIEFKAAPRAAASRLGERLYGTLTTRRGETFTGFVCWDVDEVLSGDELDGEDERGREHHLPFGTIAGIERYSSSRALVTLRNGEELVLDGTNDVNSSNRGILILDPALGQVRVGWDAFDHLVLTEPPRAVPYTAFPGQGALRGTVTTRDGDKHTGTLRWDDDEAFAWEFLDGEQLGVSYDIEFGFVERIERAGSNGARVTLRDGRRIDLRDSNDVNADNNGIYVTTRTGEEVRVDWEDFEVAVFDKP